MTPPRLVLAFALTVSGAAACGSVAAVPDGAAPTVDAAATVDAAPPATHRGLIRRAHLDDDGQPLASYALDLDGDGQIDRAFNAAMAALRDNAGYDAALALDDATARGAMMDATQLTVDGDRATFTTFRGDVATANPAPCRADGSCGHHLETGVAFALAADTWRTPPLGGAWVNPFRSDAGALTIDLVPMGTQAVTLPLIGARVELETDANGLIIDGIIGGVIPRATVDDSLIPAMAVGMEADVQRDCTDLASPPACGCSSGSVAAGWIRGFDGNGDCVIDTADLRGSIVMQTMLTSDVTIDGTAGLSLGVRIATAPATFPP